VRLRRLLLRGLGWLLTPLVAWAASFSGAWIGAEAGILIPGSTTALLASLVLGLCGAVVGLLLWMRLLRRSPRLRHTLAVTDQGVPQAALGKPPPTQEAL
jgi:uncharacterized membrane protein YeaQ/YmgE (transglycosylase-associated protein family)